MEHLALEVFDLATTENPNPTGSKFAVLEPDATITITDTSEIFADGDVWSYDFTLNVHANANLFGTAGDIHGSRLHEQINKRKARLWVEGVPLYLGYLKFGDEAEVDADGNVDISFESGQKTFEEMIEGMNARDVPMLADHLIGVAVWRERMPSINITYNIAATEVWGTQVGWENYKTVYSVDRTLTVDTSAQENHIVGQWPKHVVHSGSFQTVEGSDFDVKSNETLNTDSPYDDNAPTAHPYCNVIIGYQRKDKDGNAERGYTLHETQWPNTAPCFYVMYWFRALMKHLGIHIDENQMQYVEDMRRLFMMNTLCAYDEPEETPSATSGRGKNLKLLGKILPYYYEEKKEFAKYEYDLTESKAITINADITQLEHEINAPSIKDPVFNIKRVEIVNEGPVFGHPAYASQDCFPNVDAKNIIDALQNGFGVRLLFNDDFSRVRVVLLRDIFQSQDVSEIKCDILKEDLKVENSTRGFMMSYGSDDTAFKLPVFDKALDKEHTTDTTGNNYTLKPSDYAEVIKAASAFNKNLYYTTDNGNTYAYKVDEEAKRYKDLYPSLFEVAGFMDAVDGICSGEAETFESIALNFTPLIVNDANMEKEREGSKEQKFFAYVDAEMKQSDGDFSVGGDLYFLTKVTNAILWGGIYSDHSYYKYSANMDVEGYIFEKYFLRLKDNFEPNDDGVAPIEKHNWGLTLGIMRGSGNDAYVKAYTDPQDGEGNQTWEIMPGSSTTAHPDTCDSYGNEWMYSDGTRGAGNILEKIGIDPSFVSRWRVCDPDTLDIETYGFYPPYSSGGSYANIFCQDNVVIGERHVMVTPICSDGEILTYDQYNSYVNELKRIYNATDSALSYDERMRIVKAADYRDLLLSWSGNYPEDVFYEVWNYVLNNVAPASSLGAISLKLRAEKPNPYFDPKQPESDSNRRYLEITNKNLRQRGLCDQFYKEYSYWIRNARIVKRTVRMTLAQLQTIDKTKRVRVGDVTGFIRKMQYSVSNQTGLGNVVMEIMYI
jgi:hypothetical protein